MDFAPIIVDNTPPAISELTARDEGKVVKLTVQAHDASRITDVEYVVDSGDEPVIMESASGVFDMPTAKAQATIKDLEAGPHVITVKVRDEFGNCTTRRLT